MVGAGANTAEAVAAACGAGGDCGACRPMLAELVTNAAKPKEAILGAETEIKRMFDKK